MCESDLAYLGWVESGCVVDENIEPTEFPQCGPDQRVRRLRVEKIHGLDGDGSHANSIELFGQSQRGRRGRSIVNQRIRSRRVQRAHDFRADSPRAAGYQNHMVSKGRGIVGHRHTEERYRIVPAGCTHAP